MITQYQLVKWLLGVYE